MRVRRWPRLRVQSAYLVAIAAALTFSLGTIDVSSRQDQQGPIHPPQQPPQSPDGSSQQPPKSQAKQQQSEEQQNSPKMSVEVKEVTLYATVRDKHGKIIGNLSKDDFKLDEDGRAQKISYFAQESDLPLTLGLLVDTSLSQRRVLDDERGASGDFLDQVLREDKDQAFLVHFDREVELVQDLTSSREKLRTGLTLLQTPDLEEHASGGGHGHGGGTLLYDAIYLAANDIMSKQQGRKALIVLTDGVDRGSKETIGGAIEAVQRADTSVFSILFADENAYGPPGGSSGRWGGRGGWPGGPGGGPRRFPQQEHADGKKVLQRISKESGGEFFQITKKLSIEQVYAELQQELRNQYSLGYTPDRSNQQAGYHKIHLIANQKDVTVQARDGYYSDK